MNWLDETSTEAEKLKKELENTEWKLRELKDINGKCQTSYAFLRAIHAELLLDTMTMESIADLLERSYPSRSSKVMIDDLRAALNFEYQRRKQIESDNEKEAA